MSELLEEVVLKDCLILFGDHQPCPRQRTHVHRCLQMEERQTEQDLLQEATALRLTLAIT